MPGVKVVKKRCALTFLSRLAPFTVTVGVRVVIGGSSELAVIVFCGCSGRLKAPYSLSRYVTRVIIAPYDGSVYCFVILTDKLPQLVVEITVLNNTRCVGYLSYIASRIVSVLIRGGSNCCISVFDSRGVLFKLGLVNSKLVIIFIGVYKATAGLIIALFCRLNNPCT